MTRHTSLMVAFLLSSLNGCSFFNQHEYSTCEVEIECEEGCEARILGESASGEDSKEVELPTG
jgi:hypothetical protein